MSKGLQDAIARHIHDHCLSPETPWDVINQGRTQIMGENARYNENQIKAIKLAEKILTILKNNPDTQARMTHLTEKGITE